MVAFGFATLTDMVSAIVIMTLGAKAMGTMALLLFGQDARDRPGWGSWLWWMTKITPIIALPSAIGLALAQKQTDAALAFIGMIVFVAIAVPIKICQRRARIRPSIAA
jgi:hypothetical protein